MIELYLGPGIAGGTVIIVIGVLALIVITLFTFFWFPIKRFLKKRKK